MRGRRNTFMTQSNPIPARRSTHKLENKYITEVLLKGVRILCPTSGSSSLGVWHWEEDPPGQWGWSQELHRTGGERNSALAGCIQGFMHTRNWKKSTDFIGAWPDPSAGLGGPHGVQGKLWLTVGTRTQVENAVGNIHQCGLSWWLPFWLQNLATKNILIAGVPQAKQPAEQHHSPTHQKTGFLKYSWVHNHL